MPLAVKVPSMVGVHRIWDELLNLLYPAVCCGCGAAAVRPRFCLACEGEIRSPGAPLCPVCGAPFGSVAGVEHRCSRCLTTPPAFGRARACALYQAGDSSLHPLKAVLQRYKYHPDVTLALPLGRLLAERCPLPMDRYTLVIPVPLHLDRLRWRGFNQSHFLARTLARRTGISLDAFSLVRVRPTRPQVELHEHERRRNVKHAFRVIRPQRIEGQRIVLVDDVYTTGATVDECSRELVRSGAAAVDVLTLARAVLQ